MAERRNINRGYRKLRVWQDAKDYYVLTWKTFGRFPHEATRTASNQIASVDSIHRNIAEGYCRRSIKEYLHFLNIALSSAGESVSGLHVYRDAGQITPEQFESADEVSFKLENGLMRLIAKLQEKRDTGEWDDTFIIRESNEFYGKEDTQDEE